MSVSWTEISSPAVLGVQPLVSAKMITYNHGPFIAQAIQGVVMQKTTFPIELNICVDRSTDNTREIALDFQKRYPDIIRVFYPDTRVGAPDNSRKSFAVCRGKYLALCEGDDFWTHPEKLQKQVELLENAPDVSGCFHDCYNFNEATGVKRLHIGDRAIDQNASTASLIREMNVRTCAMVFRNIIPAAELQQWLPRTLASDYMLALLVAQRGTWRYIDIPMAVYRRHAGGIWYGKRRVEQCQITIDFMEMLIRSKKYPEVTRTIAARKRDAIRSLSIALASEGRLVQSCYQYLRSVGARRALDGAFISSSQYGIFFARKLCARLGLGEMIARFWKRVVRKEV